MDSDERNLLLPELPGDAKVVNPHSEEVLLCLIAAIIVEIINRESYGGGDRIYQEE